MREPTVYEQLLVELINRGRADPAAEAARYGIGLNDGLTAGTISTQAKAPLAINELLNRAALDHTAWQLANNTFSHTGENGSSLGQRVTAAGYNWNAAGENLSLVGLSSLNADLSAVIEQQHQNLVESAGHRRNIFSETFTEIGVGRDTRSDYVFQGQTFPTSILTEKFGRASDGARFLTGVIIRDGDGDDFYDVGEGLGGVMITATGSAGTFSTTSFGSGGYSLELPNGTYTVTVTGGDFGGVFTDQVTLSGQNVKFDADANDARPASAPPDDGDEAIGTSGNDVLEGTSASDTLDGLGGDDELSGAGGDDELFGRGGDDTLAGGSGRDELEAGGGRDLLRGGGGNDTLDAGSGADMLRGQGGADRLYGGSGTDNLNGGGGKDRLFGGDGVDDLRGGGANDDLRGGRRDDDLRGQAGSDELFGGAGVDSLIGAAGRDVLVGGGGQDRLNGGDGADVFRFTNGFGTDRIEDFDETEGDMLDFSRNASVDGLSDLSIQQKGANTHIVTDNGTVILLGVDSGSIGGNDFDF